MNTADDFGPHQHISSTTSSSFGIAASARASTRAAPDSRMLPSVSDSSRLQPASASTTSLRSARLKFWPSSTSSRSRRCTAGSTCSASACAHPGSTAQNSRRPAVSSSLRTRGHLRSAPPSRRTASASGRARLPRFSRTSSTFASSARDERHSSSKLSTPGLSNKPPNKPPSMTTTTMVVLPGPRACLRACARLFLLPLHRRVAWRVASPRVTSRHEAGCPTRAPPAALK
eukprot:scaffold3663_cov249-Prasinococcus_capsulatus_cf.AAC.2